VRISFVRELVDNREDIPNAIALNATMFNTAAVVGPAIGGLVYAAVGPGWCFTINGISFIAVLIALWMMHLAPFIPPKQSGSTILQLKEGFSYAWGEPNIRYILASTAMVSIFGFGMFTLMPAWARDVLGGDAATNGLLQSGRGLGSMIGALMLATLSHLKMRGRIWTVGSFVLPACAVWFAMMRWLPLSLLALVGLGWGLMSMLNINNAIIQMQVPDALRGRVMGIYSLVFQGGMPIGSLIIGTVATQIEEPLTVVGAAALLMAFAGFTWLARPQLRKME
jgi:predicted MFS family arabinose efflux permease